MNIYYGITDFHKIIIKELIIEPYKNNIYKIIKSTDDTPLNQCGILNKRVSEEEFDKFYTDVHCIFSKNKKFIKDKLKEAFDKEIDKLEKQLKELKKVKETIK